MRKARQLPLGNHHSSTLNDLRSKSQYGLFGFQAVRIMPFNAFLGKFRQQIALILIDPFKMAETDMAVRGAQHHRAQL